MVTPQDLSSARYHEHTGTSMISAALGFISLDLTVYNQSPLCKIHMCHQYTKQSLSIHCNDFVLLLSKYVVLLTYFRERGYGFVKMFYLMVR